MTFAADIEGKLIRRVTETSKVTTTSNNLKGMNVKLLREAASSTTAGATDLVKRIVPASYVGASLVMEG